MKAEMKRLMEIKIVMTDDELHELKIELSKLSVSPTGDEYPRVKALLDELRGS